MGDARILQFKKHWDVIYQARYSIPWKWGKGAEEKLIKDSFKYLDSSSFKDPLTTLCTASMKYINDGSDFVGKTKHDLKMFLSQLHKWIEVKKMIESLPQNKSPEEEIREQQLNSAMESFTGLDEEFLNRVKFEADRVGLERFFKGFKTTYRLLKMRSETKAGQVLNYLVKELGRTRAKELWMNVDNKLD